MHFRMLLFLRLLKKDTNYQLKVIFILLYIGITLKQAETQLYGPSVGSGRADVFPFQCKA